MYACRSYNFQDMVCQKLQRSVQAALNRKTIVKEN